MAKNEPGDNIGFIVDIERLLNGALGDPQGTEALREILEIHGGREHYIRKRTDIDRRRRKIIALFNGANYKALAKKFSLSVRHIRRIIGGE